MIEIEVLGVLENFLPHSQLEVGKGQDSTVYKCGSCVVKVYDSPLFLDTFDCANVSTVQVQLYQEVTNRAASLSIPDVIVPGVKVVVNPILLVSEIALASGINLPVSISRYIEGPNMNKDVVSAGTNYLTSRQIMSKLASISRFLNCNLNTSGIALCGVNIKFTDEEFIITDICGCVRNLKLN